MQLQLIYIEDTLRELICHLDDRDMDLLHFRAAATHTVREVNNGFLFFVDHLRLGFMLYPETKCLIPQIYNSDEEDTRVQSLAIFATQRQKTFFYEMLDDSYTFDDEELFIPGAGIQHFIDVCIGYIELLGNSRKTVALQDALFSLEKSRNSEDGIMTRQAYIKMQTQHAKAVNTKMRNINIPQDSKNIVMSLLKFSSWRSLTLAETPDVVEVESIDATSLNKPS